MKKTQNPEGFGRVMGDISRYLPWPVALLIGAIAFALALPWFLAEAVRNAYLNGRFDAVLSEAAKRRRDDKVWAGWGLFTRRFARGVDPGRWSGGVVEDLEDEG